MFEKKPTDGSEATLGESGPEQGLDGFKPPERKGGGRMLVDPDTDLQSDSGDVTTEPKPGPAKCDYGGNG